MAISFAYFIIPGLSGGNHAVSAMYSGDQNYAAATGTATAVVNPVGDTVSISVAPLSIVFPANATVTVTAADLTPNPNQIATFSADETFVTINYQGQIWNIARPMTAPWGDGNWGFTPNHTYFVDPVRGNDSNSGSQSSPFATIAHAQSVAVANDVIYLLPGTYTEANNATGASAIDINPSGIVLSCAPGALGQVLLQPPLAWFAAHAGSPQSGGGSPVLDVHGTNVIINGITIEGPRWRGGVTTSDKFAANAISVEHSNQTVQNCVCVGVNHCGVKSYNLAANCVIQANVLFMNGQAQAQDHGIYWPFDNNTLRGNVLFKNAGWGIQLFSDPTNVQVYRNVSFGNLTGGIVCASISSKYYNNTCVNNSGNGLYLYKSNCTNNDFKNNITDGWTIDTGGSSLPSGNTVSFDDTFPGGPFTGGTGVTAGSGEIGKNPLFVNSTAGDYRLQATSPCKGAGTGSTNLPGQGATPDMGAFG